MGLVPKRTLKTLAVLAALAWLTACAGPARRAAAPLGAPAPATVDAAPVIAAAPAEAPRVIPNAAVLPSGSLLAPDGRVLDDAGFLALAAQADYVLLGESHASRCDHLVQAHVVELLAGGANPPAVGLEMVATPRQEILDRFDSGEISVDELESALDWPETWGHDYALYKPVFEAVRQANLPLRALNMPSDVNRTVGREGLGALTSEQQAFLPSVILLPTPAQRDELAGFFGEHPVSAPGAGGEGGEGGEKPTPEQEQAGRERIERFLLAQSLWDGAMAENAAKARRETGRPVVILAGYGHVVNGWGVAYRLPSFDPGARVLLVCPWRGQPGESLEGADVLFFCPPVFASRLGMTLEERAGVVRIIEVTPGSRAEKSGILAGDVLKRAGDRAVNELGDLHAAGADAHKADKELVLTLTRGDAEVVVGVGKLGKKKGEGEPPEPPTSE